MGIASLHPSYKPGIRDARLRYTTMLNRFAARVMPV